MCKKLGSVLLLAMMLMVFPVMVYAQTGEEEGAQEDEYTESVEEISLDEASQEDNTFSEDGNATLGDSATSADDKEFITVTTRNGNVFYLIIDHQRNDNNVYFLNMVDESDLQAFIEERGDTGLESIVSLPAEEETASETIPEIPEESEEIEGQDVVTEGLAQAQSGSNLNYLLVIIVIGVFGVAYYFKIHKKKQQSSYDEYETEEEYEEDEYEPDDVNEEDNEYLDEEYDEDDFEQEELKARQEAERQAKLEEERLVKLEEERIRNERIKEKQEELRAERQKLEDEQNRLKEEQRRIEEAQSRINEEQEQLETGEDGVF